MCKGTKEKRRERARERRRNLEVDRASEEEDVQECGVGEVSESLDALQRDTAQLFVHSLTVPMQCSV